MHARSGWNLLVKASACPIMQYPHLHYNPKIGRRIRGGNVITSTITVDAENDLKLAKGDEVAAGEQGILTQIPIAISSRR